MSGSDSAHHTDLIDRSTIVVENLAEKMPENRENSVADVYVVYETASGEDSFGQRRLEYKS